MPFISELINRPVMDVDGKRIGRLKDLVARSRPDLAHPVIEAIIFLFEGQQYITASAAVAAWTPAAIPLKCRLEDLPAFLLNDEDIWLARDVLDKQIIDTEGARVVRVNDLELLRINGKLYVGNVDAGGLGILRRLGLAQLTQGTVAGLRLPLKPNFIAWDEVELLRNDQSMRLKVPVETLKELHPADVAEILADLNRLEGGQVLQALDLEHQADALEEVEPDFQASLVQDMSDERVADILEEMEPDEAADLLAELPQDRSRELLTLMQADEAADVRRLLAYPEDSAGGIMTTEFAALKPDLTASQAIEVLRATAQEAETVFYIYVIDDQDHLLGVFSLSSLIFARPEIQIAEFMVTRLVSVDLYAKQDEVAQVIAKYDLLAVPVVDAENRLQGIVTADDALDKIIPTAWKKRLPHFFR